MDSDGTGMDPGLYFGCLILDIWKSWCPGTQFRDYGLCSCKVAAARNQILKSRVFGSWIEPAGSNSKDSLLLPRRRRRYAGGPALRSERRTAPSSAPRVTPPPLPARPTAAGPPEIRATMARWAPSASPLTAPSSARSRSSAPLPQSVMSIIP